MKKLILLTLTALIMAGCKVSVETNPKANYHVILLDSCEYVYNVYGLAHKGNCRFCEERDSIKWEKRRKELEELVIKLKEK